MDIQKWVSGKIEIENFNSKKNNRKVKVSNSELEIEQIENREL